MSLGLVRTCWFTHTHAVCVCVSELVQFGFLSSFFPQICEVPENAFAYLRVGFFQTSISQPTSNKILIQLTSYIFISGICTSYIVIPRICTSLHFCMITCDTHPSYMITLTSFYTYILLAVVILWYHFSRCLLFCRCSCLLCSVVIPSSLVIHVLPFLLVLNLMIKTCFFSLGACTQQPPLLFVEAASRRFTMPREISPFRVPGRRRWKRYPPLPSALTGTRMTQSDGGGGWLIGWLVCLQGRHCYHLLPVGLKPVSSIIDGKSSEDENLNRFSNDSRDTKNFECSHALGLGAIIAIRWIR